MRERRMRGYTLLEVVVAMAVFGIFLMILTVLMLEMSKQEKRFPVNFMQHPQVIAVLGRIKRDVQDGYGENPYDPERPPAEYSQGPQTLILQKMEDKRLLVVVWDFRTPGEVTRVSYNVGVPTRWVARGLPPDFSVEIKSEEIPGHPFGTRIQARDKNGKLSIDQILQPRAHD